jgi:sterol desaturase/sphingolipid hydroxylase (fatty acid hydroxylase superfamily)
MSSSLSLLAVAAGVVTWTFLEYVLHRFLGHDRRTFPNPFGVEHTRHHSEGDDFAPGWKKALAAVAALLVVSPLAVLVAGRGYGGTYAVAFVTMYVAYEVVHRRAHTHRGLGAYGRFLRRHHFHHHFANTRANHGVTTPLWDFVFRTREVPGRLRVPEKLAMRWLVDPATGDVREEFQPHYELVRARPPRGLLLSVSCCYAFVLTNVLRGRHDQEALCRR